MTLRQAILICSSLLMTLSGPSHADNIFSVGHSLLGEPAMPDSLNALARDAGISHLHHNQMIPGASLQHNYQSPGATHVDSYTAELNARQYDAFIVTAAMPVQIHIAYAETLEYALSFYDYAVAHNPSIRYYVYQTWDCIYDGRPDDYSCPEGRADTPWDTKVAEDLPHWESIADNIIRQRSANNVNIIPGGQALVALNREIQRGNVPGITSINDVFDDGIHLNDMGWYFMSLVQFATVYQRDPAGLTNTVPRRESWEAPYSLPSSATAAKMQEIAWETVCNYPRSGVNCGAQVTVAPPSAPHNVAASVIRPVTGGASGGSSSGGSTGGTSGGTGSGSTTGGTSGGGTSSGGSGGTGTGSSSSTGGVAPLLAGCAADRANNASNSNPYSYNGEILMGNNLSQAAYWEGAYPFLDLRRQADHEGGWVVEGSGAQFDSDGNVIRLTSGLARTGFIGNSSCVYSGDYVLLWNPQHAADVDLYYSGPGTWQLVEDDAANGRRVYSLSISGNYRSAQMGVHLNAPITGDVDYHVLMPGTEQAFNQGQRFHPDFVDHLRGNEVIRYMDLLATNDSPVRNPEDLPSARSNTWGSGMPFGATMELTKAVGADIAWINIPHMATDATITEIARQVYAEWEPGITVYLEFSNEVWNTIFSQTGYAQAQGAAQFGENGIVGMSLWLSDRSITAKRIFQTAFGNNANSIKLVMGGIVDDSSGYVGQGDFECYMSCRITNNFNNISQEIDVWTIAPYFSGNLHDGTFSRNNRTDQWSFQQLANNLLSSQNSSLETLRTHLNAHYSNLERLTGRTDIVFAAYEFGQHIIAEWDVGGPYDQRYLAFQNSAEMGDVYQQIVQLFIDSNITVAANYLHIGTHGIGHYWGNYQSIGDAANPRTLAIEAAY